MPFSNLDSKDSGILRMLNEDSRATTQAIADALDMPRVTVHDRIKRLQDREIINKFSVEINRRELGWPLHGFILANWAGQREDIDRRFVAEEICKMPFVVGCHIVTGQWDFIVEVVAKDMANLGDSILDQLSEINGVGHTQTLVSFYSFNGAAKSLG